METTSIDASSLNLIDENDEFPKGLVEKLLKWNSSLPKSSFGVGKKEISKDYIDAINKIVTEKPSTSFNDVRRSVNWNYPADRDALWSEMMAAVGIDGMKATSWGGIGEPSIRQAVIYPQEKLNSLIVKESQASKGNREEVSNIYNKQLSNTEINSVRASLRKKAPDSTTLQYLDDYQAALKGSQTAGLDMAVEEMLNNGVTLNDIGSLLIDEDIFETSRDVKNYFNNIGELGLTPRMQPSKGGRENLAPNGKPSNLNDAQYEQVRTPEFKKWFGDWENDPENSSKIVDENGEPLVTYHGTKNKFDEFKFEKMSWEARLSQQGPGFYLTNNKKEASGYGKPMNAFASIKNPLIVSAASSSISKEQAYELFKNGDYDYFYSDYLPFYTKTKEENLTKDQLIKKYVDGMVVGFGFDKKVLQNIKRAYNQDTGYEKMMSDVSSILGVDGVIEKVSESTSVYVTFNPNQIKSATDNTGEFSTTDNRIQASKGNRDVQATFSQATDLFYQIRNTEGAAKKKRLADERKALMDANPSVKYIDDNIKNILDQLEKNNKATRKGNCP